MDPTSIIAPALRQFLPPEMVDYIDKYVLHPESLFQGFRRQSVLVAQQTADFAQPHIEPLYHRLILFIDQNQGYAGLAVCLALITAVFVIMNWIRRLMLWWTRLMLRMAFYGVVVLLLAVAWERGPLQSVRDVVVFAGKFVGYLAAVKDIWLKEYDQYEQSARASGRASRQI